MCGNAADIGDGDGDGDGDADADADDANMCRAALPRHVMFFNTSRSIGISNSKAQANSSLIKATSMFTILDHVFRNANSAACIPQRTPS